ncbi:MAG: hypothetical protein Q8J76_10925, partial [Desulfobulbaceae bacterium]|nr:hypothetical protein [Desulfobulbaceae bacterium]
NCYQQDTFPISITKDCVHILGVAGPDGSYQMMDPPTDTAIFSLASAAENCEIAYFSLGGLAQGTHGAIELQGANNQTHIHHCTFGHWWTSGGQDGIRVVAGSHFSVVIEDCWFFGVSATNGKLSRYGIYSLGVTSIGQWTIRNNKFIMLPTTAICLQGNAIHEVIVDENIIACRADAVATAIDLGLNALGCLITRNRAGYGAANMVQNPYLDQAPAGSNHWSDNMQGNQYAYGA